MEGIGSDGKGISIIQARMLTRALAVGMARSRWICYS